MVSHGKIGAMTYSPDKTAILEVEDVPITVIVGTTKDVVMVREITVVIMVVTTVTQTTVAALLLGVD